MASAILIDATVIRLFLVPALMELMGERAWHLPRWLDRLVPHTDLEGSASLPSPAAAAVRAPRTPSESPVPVEAGGS